MIMFSVGQVIRVKENKSGTTCRAIVSFVNGDGTVDVIYQNNASSEESSVIRDRILLLESFEVDNNYAINPEQQKNDANIIFALKDYSAAIDMYKRALALLNNSCNLVTLSVGTTVVMAVDKSINFVSGIVSGDCGDGRLDIMLDDDEAEGVAADKLTAVPASVEDRMLQRSLLMNLARCCLKLNFTGWAIRYVSLALAVTQLLKEDSTAGPTVVVDKQLADCYYLRCKALLQTNRPRFALQDAVVLNSFDAARSAALQAEVAQYRARRQKADRRLARDIAKWVDKALGGGDDLQVLDDEGDDQQQGMRQGRGSEVVVEKQSAKGIAVATTHEEKTRGFTAAAKHTTSSGWLLVVVAVAVIVIARFVFGHI